MNDSVSQHSADTGALIDSILVSAFVFLADGKELPQAVESTDVRVKSHADGSVTVRLGAVEVETNNNDERQRGLAEALNSLWTAYSAAGFSKDGLSANSQLTVAFALGPYWGQAASSIPASALRPWINVDADIHITAYPR